MQVNNALISVAAAMVHRHQIQYDRIGLFCLGQNALDDCLDALSELFICVCIFKFTQNKIAGHYNQRGDRRLSTTRMRVQYGLTSLLAPRVFSS